jgi:hypothetical protein
MVNNTRTLDKTEMLVLLEMLSQELAAIGEKVSVYVVGGAGIAFIVDQFRTTTDIDVVVRFGLAALREAAAKVAIQVPGLEADWINNAFTGGEYSGGNCWPWFDQHHNDIGTLVFSSPNLSVECASPEMILALKTMTVRFKDIDDIRKLLAYTNIHSKQDLLENLFKYTGPRLFNTQGRRDAPVNINYNVDMILANIAPG